MNDISLVNIVAACAAFVSILNDMAGATAAGIFPFSQCGPENRSGWENGILYLDDLHDGPSDMGVNDVIADKLVDGDHHDAISGMGQVLSGICKAPVSVFVAVPDKDDHDGKPYVSVTLGWPELEIVIEGGTWRAV